MECCSQTCQKHCNFLNFSERSSMQVTIGDVGLFTLLTRFIDFPGSSIQFLVLISNATQSDDFQELKVNLQFEITPDQVILRSTSWAIPPPTFTDRMKPFGCSICKKRFKTKKGRKSHVILQHEVGLWEIVHSNPLYLAIALTGLFSTLALFYRMQAISSVTFAAKPLIRGALFKFIVGRIR